MHCTRLSFTYTLLLLHVFEWGCGHVVCYSERNHEVFLPSQSPSDLVFISRGSSFLPYTKINMYIYFKNIYVYLYIKLHMCVCTHIPASPTQSIALQSSSQAHILSAASLQGFRSCSALGMPFIPPWKPFLLFHLSPHLLSSLVPNILLGAKHSQESSKYFMRALSFLAGWYEGERLRDGERGWFPMECAKEITCQATIDKNVERMGRLLGLETNV